MVRVQLLKNTAANSELPKEAEVLNIVADKVHVPADETTYWCHVHKLPDEFQDKHHVVQVGKLKIKKTKQMKCIILPHFSLKQQYKKVMKAWCIIWKCFIALHPQMKKFPFISVLVLRPIGLKRRKSVRES